MRKSAVLLATGAVLLLAAAAVTRFVVLPAVHQVPADLDATTHYAGTVTMLNAPALATGDVAKLFLTDVPVTAAQQVKVTSTSGKTAVMSSVIKVSTADGTALLTSEHLYAVDRVTLGAAPPPAGSNAEAYSGLALGFPLTPSESDYKFWDATTQTATPAYYRRTESRSGRTAYVYVVHATGAVQDAKIKAALPTALPKAALPALAGGLPAAIQQALTPMLPQLPDSLPLTYSSTTDTTAWVDSATGVVLDIQQKQTITASLTGPTGAIPLAAVLDLDLKNTDEAVADNVTAAADAESGLLLIGTIAPLTLGGLGVLLLVLAIVFGRRRPVAATPSQEPSSPAATPVA